MTTTADPIDLPRRRVRLLRQLAREPLGLISGGVVTLVILTAIIGPLIAPLDPNTPVLRDVLAPPSPEHLLGGDASGRDVLSRLLFATRFSVLGATIALLTALAIGVVTGLVAGYYGHWFDNVASWVTNLVMALPGIIILLAARTVIGPNMWWTMFIFGVILSPSFFRLTRALVHSVRDELYVDAARVSGLGDRRIIFRHVLGVVRPPVVIQMAIVGVIAISLQAGLEFLGLGDPSLPTWGSMLNEAYKKIYVAPLLLLWPGLAITLTGAALVLLASAMRDALGGRRRAAAAPAVTARTSDDLVRETSALLSVTDLAVGYSKDDGSILPVVKGISFDVSRGEVLGLVGESGSGKTQTAFSILRLLPRGGAVIAGSIRWDGVDLGALSDSEMRRIRGPRIGYVPQEPMSNLDPTFSIGSQLIEPMRITLGLTRSEAARRAEQLLSRVGIPDPARMMRLYPHELSGGMAQRVLIAGAVSCDPDLVIADEPTSALDVTVQAEVLQLLRELQRERSMALLIVTHDIGVVADICTRVAVMSDGRLVETGDVRDVLERPAHEYTRSLLSTMLDSDGPTRVLNETGTTQ